MGYSIFQFQWLAYIHGKMQYLFFRHSVSSSIGWTSFLKRTTLSLRELYASHLVYFSMKYWLIFSCNKWRNLCRDIFAQCTWQSEKYKQYNTNFSCWQIVHFLSRYKRFQAFMTVSKLKVQILHSDEPRRTHI